MLSTPARRRLALPTSWPRVDARMLILGGVTFLVLYLTVIPLLVMFWFSVRTAGPGEIGGTFTLDKYAEAYLNPTTYRLLANTAVFVVGSSLFGLALGVGFAWLVERTNTPLKGFAYVIVPLTAATPGVLFAISWILLLSPRIGLYNLPFTQGLGWQTAPFQPYNLGGMILVEGIRIIPTVFLMVIGLFRSMDPALEEAAASTGAGTWTTLRKVTLPMMLPGILAVLIYMGTGLMGAFEIPALLGMQDGIYVFSTRIYVATHKMPRDYGLAGSLSTVFAITAIVGILLYHRVLRVQQRFATVTGKAFRPRSMDLGRWKWVGAAAIIVYFIFVVLMPALILIWASLQPFYQVPSVQSLQQVSLDAYTRLFSMPWMGDALRNTAILLLVVPTAVMALSAVVSWIVVRTQTPGRKLLDSLVFLPHTMPSIVIGLSFLWMYLILDFIPIYGTIWIISLAMLTGYLAFGTRTTNAAMFQLHKELEEAGSVTGASWLTVFRKITLPLLIPTLIGGWVWVAIHAVRELTVALMLASPQSRIVSVLIWNFWETGDIGMTAATGVLLIIFIATILALGRLVSVKMFKAG